jgi:hypothetical protein
VCRPGATLGIVGRRADLSIAYDPYYSDYKNNEYLSRWSHAANLSANWQMTKNTRAFLTDNFIYTEDPQEEDAITGRSGRNPYFRNTSVVGITNQFGARDFITLQYTHREFQEDTEFGVPSDDSTTYSPEVIMAYWFNSRWGFDGRLTYTNGQFEITEDFENTYADLRLIYNYSRRWDFFVRYAHTYQDYKEESEDYQIYYPSLGFEYTYDDTTFLSLEGGPLVRDYADRSEEVGYTVFADGRKSWLFQRGNVDVYISNGSTTTTCPPRIWASFITRKPADLASYNFLRESQRQYPRLLSLQCLCGSYTGALRQHLPGRGGPAVVGGVVLLPAIELHLCRPAVQLRC